MFSLEAYSTKEFRTSKTRIKSMGEGVTLTKTVMMKIVSPGSPFTNNRVEEVDRIRHNRSHHCYPTPNCRITSRRKDQETESKALEISNFRRI